MNNRNTSYMKKIISILIAGFCIYSCGKEEPITPDNPTSENHPVTLTTKVTDGAFVEGASVGIYMVNYIDGGTATLKPSGNYVDNRKFSYYGTGGWKSDKTLYFKDDKTPVDFYAYSPYSTVSDATNYSVSVVPDQSVESAYEASDFLWGKSLGCLPSSSPVNITVNHMMSKVIIILNPGAGFTEEELIALSPVVQLPNLKCNASFNMGTGAFSQLKSEKSVTPYKVSSLKYQALVLPQSVEEYDIVVITIGENEYELRRTMTFEPGREYTFTVVLQRSEGGVNVGIGSWDVIDEDFGGIVS